MPFECCRSCRDGRRYNATAPPGSKCRPGCVRPTPAQAHCPACHSTFGGVTNFDRHRDAGHCLDPAVLGMECRDGVWRTPMTSEARERLDAL